jgi:hypothetical protein
MIPDIEDSPSSFAMSMPTNLKANPMLAGSIIKIKENIKHIIAVQINFVKFLARHIENLNSPETMYL